MGPARGIRAPLFLDSEAQGGLPTRRGLWEGLLPREKSLPDPSQDTCLPTWPQTVVRSCSLPCGPQAGVPSRRLPLNFR